MSDSGMAFGLLGPLLIRHGEVEYRVRSSRQRVMAATLLLRAGQVVPTDELVERLWADNTPGKPRQALHNHVMRVRQLLGPDVGDRLRTQTSGYVFDVQPGELDIQTFADLRERGRAAAAAGHWDLARSHADAALELWRGEPLVDIPSASLQSEYCEPLLQARLLAEELHADADLQLGHYAEAVTRFRTLTTANPWHEHLQGKLMLALYGSGRQAESLAAFRAFRLAVTEELGIEPASDLRELHQRILRQDPVSALLNRTKATPQTTLTATSPSPPPEPPPVEVVADPLVDARVEKAHAPARGKRRRVLGSWATVAMLLVVGFTLGWPGLDGSTHGRASAADTGDPLPSPLTAAPDGKVAFVSRAGSDAQVLTTTSVDVPIVSDVARGDSVIVSLDLTATSAGPVTVTDTAGNVYTEVGDVVDAYWHHTMIFAAFDVAPLDTADSVSAHYPKSSKYAIAIDTFHGLAGASGEAGDSSLRGPNTSTFSTSAHPLACRRGDLLAAAIATNTGTAPTLSSGWQTLPVLKLSSYRLTTAYRFIAADGRCAATGHTTAQWEAVAVDFHRQSINVP